VTAPSSTEPVEPAEPTGSTDGVDPTGGVDGVEPSDRARPRRTAPRFRWGAISGVVVLGYTLVYALALTGLGDRLRFARWGRAMSSLGARVVIAGVILAALFHTFDGLRRMAIDLHPELAAQNPRWRATVLFFTWALAVPAAAIVVWPWISATTR